MVSEPDHARRKDFGGHTGLRSFGSPMRGHPKADSSARVTPHVGSACGNRPRIHRCCRRRRPLPSVATGAGPAARRVVSASRGNGVRPAPDVAVRPPLGPPRRRYPSSVYMPVSARVVPYSGNGAGHPPPIPPASPARPPEGGRDACAIRWIGPTARSATSIGTAGDRPAAPADATRQPRRRNGFPVHARVP